MFNSKVRKGNEYIVCKDLLEKVANGIAKE
jgi:hypothetical protein